MERIHEAQSTFMQRWSERLTAQLRHAGSHFELARELVVARAQLRSRVLLVSHPSLPDQVRAALRSGLETDLRNLQQQLEEAAVRNDERARTDRGAADRLLMVMRQNSMVAALGPISDSPHIA